MRTRRASRLVGHARTAALLAWTALLTAGSAAEEVTFPADAGVIDVTKAPYWARGDGATDDTPALQRALNEHANRARIVFLPAGTYVISDTLAWPRGEQPGADGSNVILQGQSRERTVLKLKDGCAGFDDPDHAKAMVGTGGGPGPRLRNAVRNLTLDTGKKNAGAVGLQFAANKQGCVRDVIIRSGDGAGPVGLDLSQGEPTGPCLIKNVTVVGFDCGIKAAGDASSLTFEGITLERQSICGLVNDGPAASVRGLTSRGSVEAVMNQGDSGQLALIDATLQGSRGARWRPGVWNDSTLYARNVEAAGYLEAVENLDGGARPRSKRKVDEFVSHPVESLFDPRARSLGLPVKETPEVPWDNHAYWANPVQFGAVPDDNEDDTLAIQAAIDSGKTTVYLPNGYYLITDTILIRNHVRRLIGCEAILGIINLVDRPAFRVVEGSSPVVVFERFQAGFSRTTTLENASGRTLVIRDCLNVCGNLSGPGETFIEDVSSNPFTNWRFGRQNVWARQLSVENEGTHIVNDGGALWILGLTTERGGTLIETLNGGRTEVVGGLCRSTGGTKVAPMFLSRDSSVSITLGETVAGGGAFSTLISETREGTTRMLLRGQVPQRSGGSVIPLFVGRAADR